MRLCVVVLGHMFRAHLDHSDEDLELVDVELKVHAVSEPGPQQVHGAGVPLLEHTQTQCSPARHTVTGQTHTIHTHTSTPVPLTKPFRKIRESVIPYIS